MTDLSTVSITSAAEPALKRLKKAGIPVYNCKKRGASFIFCVKDKDIKKVFAIFAKPCYNIGVERASLKKRLFGGLFLRAGLVLGALAFAVVAYASGFLILRIEVGGSGGYLKSVVRQIIEEEGASEWKPFSALDKPVAAGRILALPEVTFCNIFRRGSVLVVDVEVDGSAPEKAVREPLVSDVSGVVRRLVAVCGTAAVAEGASVSAGDTLIYAGTQAGENWVEGIAAGFAEIECSAQREYFAPDGSEKSISEAYASLKLGDENIISKSHTLKPEEGGVRVIMEIKYLHKISINLT